MRDKEHLGADFAPPDRSGAIDESHVHICDSETLKEGQELTSQIKSPAIGVEAQLGADRLRSCLGPQQTKVRSKKYASRRLRLNSCASSFRITINRSNVQAALSLSGLKRRSTKLANREH